MFILGAGAVVNKDRQLDAPRIRAHLTESSERKRDEDLAAAERAPTAAERERLAGIAAKADAVRKARIDDLVETFVFLDARTDSTPVLREMTRILSEEGVDAALAYIDRQRGSVFERIRARDDAVHAQNRAELQPLLQAAGLQAAKGQNDLARKGYRDVLAVEPKWPGALEVFGWFLVDQAIHSRTHRTIGVALADAKEAFTVAQSLSALDETAPRSRRLLAAALEECGDTLRLRGQMGDADQAFHHYTRCLEIRDALFRADPNSLDAARDMALGLNRLGDFLVTRGLPGDADKALEHYSRSLAIGETILAATPASPEAARNVAVCLNTMGDYLSQRRQGGDLDLAFRHYTRALELAEGLVKAMPGVVLLQRDVSVSLGKLGFLLVVRGQPGDAAKAFDHYMRSLSICEEILRQGPDSTQGSRDVTVCLERLGDFLMNRGQRGDRDHAYACYTRCLEMREAMLKADPDSAQAARNLFIVVSKLGEFLATRGRPEDSEQALKYTLQSLELAEGLLKANPGSALETRDVAVCLNKVGDLLIARGREGDGDQALEHFKRSLALAEGLHDANPGSAVAARDVSFTLNKIGLYLSARAKEGDLDDAYARYTRSLEISEGLMRADPASTLATRDVFVCLSRINLFLAVHGTPENAGTALSYATRSLEITEGLLKANPESNLAAHDVYISLNQLGTYYSTHGQPDKAKEQWQRASEILARVTADGADIPTPVSG